MGDVAPTGGMNISALSIFALYLALTDAAAKLSLVFHGDDTAAEPAAAEGPQGCGINRFIEDNIADMACDPFKNWNKDSKTTPLVFRNITDHNVRAIVAFALKYPDDKEQVPLEEFTKRRGELEKFAGTISAADVRACHSEQCLEMLSRLFLLAPNKIPQTSLEALRGPQVNSMLKGLLKEMEFGHRYFVNGQLGVDGIKEFQATVKDSANSKILAKFNSIPNKVRESFAKLFLTCESGNLAAFYPAAFLKSLLATPANCDHLSLNSLKVSLADPSKQPFFTADCMAHVSVLGDLKWDISVKLDKLPDDALAKFSGVLDDTITPYLKAAVVANVGKNIHENERPGMGVSPSVMTEANIKSLAQAHLLGRLHSCENSCENVSIGATEKATKAIPANILKTMTTKENGYTALRSLASETIDRLPATVFGDLINLYPEVCDKIDATNAARFINIQVENSECFRRMKPGTQALALVTAKFVHPHSLRHLDADKMGKWKYTPKDKSEVTGPNIIHLSKLANLNEVVFHIGEDPDGLNPCYYIGGHMSFFVENSKLATGISAKCFLAKPHSTSDMDEKALKAIPRRLSFLMSPKDLRKKDEAYFKGITKEEMAWIISGGAFCAHADANLRNRFSDAVWNSMTGHCFSELPERELLTAVQIAAFPPTVFAEVGADRITLPNLKHMSEEQIKSACSKVTDTKNNNLGAIFTADLIGELNDNQVGAVTAEQWSGAPADSFKGFTEAKLKIVAPAAMTHWKLAQVQAVPVDVMTKLSPDQAKEIGSKAATGVDDPVLHLANMEVSDETLAALNERLPEDKRVSRGLGVWLWVIIVVVVLVVAGGAAGAYFYMRS